VKLKNKKGQIFGPVRVREVQPEPGIPGGSSFPSAHTADNFVAAAVIAMFYRRWGWIYGLMAALVGYSRMYTGVHWPSDVIFSVFLGLGIGVLGTLGIDWLWRRWGGRIFPKWHERHPSLLKEADA